MANKVSLLIKETGTELTGITRYVRSFIDAIGGRAELVILKNSPLPIVKKIGKTGLRLPGLSKELFVTANPAPDEDSVLYISDQTLVGCLLWKKYKKVVVAIHDLATFAGYDPFAELKWGFWDRIINFIIIKAAVRADVIVTFSQFTKREILKYLGCPENKVRVIYEGVGNEFVYRPAKKTGTDILYLGSEEPRKNVEVLIRAFALMKQKNSKLRLIKAGKSRWDISRAKIKALIKSLGLEQDVIFKEYVDDVVSVYNAADVFVFPSRYEGFGLPVLEAMACGLPVVCSNAASLPELVGDAAVMFDPDNEVELAEKTLEVINSPEKQTRMRERGLERAKLFNWEKHAGAMLDLYQELA